MIKKILLSIIILSLVGISFAAEKEPMSMKVEIAIVKETFKYKELENRIEYMEKVEQARRTLKKEVFDIKVNSRKDVKPPLYESTLMKFYEKTLFLVTIAFILFVIIAVVRNSDFSDHVNLVLLILAYFQLKISLLNPPYR